MYLFEFAKIFFLSYNHITIQLLAHSQEKNVLLKALHSVRPSSNSIIHFFIYIPFIRPKCDSPVILVYTPTFHSIFIVKFLILLILYIFNNNCIKPPLIIYNRQINNNNKEIYFIKLYFIDFGFSNCWLDWNVSKPKFKNWKNLSLNIYEKIWINDPL